MQTGLKMNIQDYFKRIGISPANTQDGMRNRLGDINEKNAFSQVLSAAKRSAEAPAARTGLNIRDYVARPLPARASLKLHSNLPSKGADHTPPEPAPAKPAAIETLPIEKNEPIDGKPGSAPGEVGEKDRILNSIDAAAKKYNLPKSLIRAVVQAESNYQVRAISPAGAQGLMQLMPPTAKEMGVADPFNIDQNIDGGAKYLRRMLDRFDGDVKIALSAYNAGPGTVSKYNGNVPYKETRNYVERVMRFSRQFS